MKSYKVQLSLFFLISIYANTSVNVSTRMKIYSYKTELFPEIPILTAEEKAYEFLCSKPIEKNINYLAVPWGVFFRRKNFTKVTLFKKLNDGFTICQHVEYRKIIPTLRELGVNILFAPHASKRQEYKDITVLPFPLYPINGIGPAKKKDILYSFIGSQFHSTRIKIFRLLRQPDVVIKRRKNWHFYVSNETRREQERKEYQNVLARSRFSLCPRGTGPSSIRFWESLQAGAIPVLIADAMVLPEIEGINWNDCIVRISEGKVSFIDRIVRAISLEKEAQMRENCLHVFALICEGENFVQVIRDYFEKNYNY